MLYVKDRSLVTTTQMGDYNELKKIKVKSANVSATILQVRQG